MAFLGLNMDLIPNKIELLFEYNSCLFIYFLCPQIRNWLDKTQNWNLFFTRRNHYSTFIFNFHFKIFRRWRNSCSILFQKRCFLFCSGVKDFSARQMEKVHIHLLSSNLNVYLYLMGFLSYSPNILSCKVSFEKPYNIFQGYAN